MGEKTLQTPTPYLDVRGKEGGGASRSQLGDAQGSHLSVWRGDVIVVSQSRSFSFLVSPQVFFSLLAFFLLLFTSIWFSLCSTWCDF